MKGFSGGMAQLMKQANQMQGKMKKVQEELAKAEYEGTAGGGVVTVKVNGEYKMTSLIIKEDVIKSGDVEMVQDLVLAATNEAVKIARETSQKEMEKVTGGMNIPGLF
ncbi:MAG: YbaB/EbfC family nucleoid-associated protein [Bdellovibrionales bacterium]|nr:YbaB/EbfC family nucleoid-associated protein [Bdellovibrionales bacterium]